MTSRLFFIWAVCLALSFYPGQADADIGGLLSQWQQMDPGAYGNSRASVEKLKKQQEKQFKDQIDKAFQSEFEAVFGKTLKPSQVYDGMKAVEAFAAGDYHYAAKEGGTWVLGIIAPTLNSYVGVVQKTYKLMKAAEKVWVNDLYYTDAYWNAQEIVEEEIRDPDRPYVPSYLFKFNPADPKNAGIKAIWEEMKNRERQMHHQWRSKDDAHKRAVEQICMHNEWKTRLVSALGKMPTDREIFNHFLYRYTSGGHRQKLVEILNFRYLEPLVSREARAVKARFSVAMARAVNAAASAAQEAEKEAGDKKKKEAAQPTPVDPKVIAAKCRQWEAALQVSEFDILNKTAPHQGFVRAKAAFEADKRQYDAILEQIKPDNAEWKALKRQHGPLSEEFQGLAAQMKAIDDIPDDQLSKAQVDTYNSLRQEAKALAEKGNALVARMREIEARMTPLIEKLRPLNNRQIEAKDKAWKAFETKFRTLGRQAGFTGMGQAVSPILADYGFSLEDWNTYYNGAMEKERARRRNKLGPLIQKYDCANRH